MDNQAGFTFACSHCGQHLEADLDMVGMEFECPSCGKTSKIPAPMRGNDTGISKTARDASDSATSFDSSSFIKSYVLKGAMIARNGLTKTLMIMKNWLPVAWHTTVWPTVCFISRKIRLGIGTAFSVTSQHATRIKTDRAVFNCWGKVRNQFSKFTVSFVKWMWKHTAIPIYAKIANYEPDSVKTCKTAEHRGGNLVTHDFLPSFTSNSSKDVSPVRFRRRRFYWACGIMSVIIVLIIVNVAQDPEPYTPKNPDPWQTLGLDKEKRSIDTYQYASSVTTDELTAEDKAKTSFDKLTPEEKAQAKAFVDGLAGVMEYAMTHEPEVRLRLSEKERQRQNEEAIRQQALLLKWRMNLQQHANNAQNNAHYETMQRQLNEQQRQINQLQQRQMRPCPSCNGTGIRSGIPRPSSSYYTPNPCHYCRGTGVVLSQR